MVQHHEQPEDDGAEGHRQGHHNHHRNHQHEDDNGTHRQKHSHRPPIEPKKVPETPKVPKVDDPVLGKKVENSDAHHNLYVKKTTAALEISTTTETVRSRREAPTASQTAVILVSNSLGAENQTQPPMVRQEGSDDHDNDHNDHEHSHDDHSHGQDSLHNQSQDHIQEKAEV